MSEHVHDAELAVWRCKYDGSVHRRGVHHLGDTRLLPMDRVKALADEWHKQLAAIPSVSDPVGAGLQEGLRTCLSDLRALLAEYRTPGEHRVPSTKEGR